MANSKSAKAYIKVTKRNYLRNSAQKSKIKTLIKLTTDAIENKSEDVKEVLQNTLKTIDKVAGKGIIHKKKASRLKSKLMTQYNKSLKEEKAKPKEAKAKEAKPKTTKKSTAKKPTEKKTSKTKTETKTEVKSETKTEVKAKKKETTKEKSKKTA